MKKSIWWLVLGCVAACSGLRGKAEDFYAQGAYREAIATYEAALQSDPKDEESVAGLKRARTAFLDRKLIEVRMARLAANQKLALDSLLEIVQLESQWGYFPPGKLAITQEEESAEALRFVESQVTESLRSERPLRGLYWLRHYGEIFSGALSGRKAYVERQLSQAGKKQCDTLSTTDAGSKPYFNEFVRKVCTAWSLEPKQKKRGKTKKEDLYGSIQVSSRVAGLTPALRSTMEGVLEDSFESTPWYQAGGRRVLRLQLDGDFLLHHRQVPEERVHGYTVDIPYTAYETQNKTREVPYTDYERRCQFNGSASDCQNVPVTRYRTEHYTEEQPVTRYRQEQRRQHYDGIQHSQRLELHAVGPLELGAMSRPLRLDAQVLREGFEHHWNMPRIGLRPEKPELEDPKTWVQTQAQMLGTDLRLNASEIWNKLYCEPTAADPTLVATGDLVHRCLRLRRQNPPEFANAWYERFFGVTVAQADSLLKLGDL